MKEWIGNIIQLGILIALVFLVIGIYQMIGIFTDINLQLGRIHGRLHELPGLLNQ